MSRDGLRIEIWELEKTMRGINPKLACYKEMQKKLAELKKKLYPQFLQKP